MSSQQTSIIDLLVATQTELISYQRKHINELAQTVSQIMSDRNALRDQVNTFKKQQQEEMERAKGKEEMVLVTEDEE